MNEQEAPTDEPAEGQAGADVQADDVQADEVQADEVVEDAPPTEADATADDAGPDGEASEAQAPEGEGKDAGASADEGKDAEASEGDAADSEASGDEDARAPDEHATETPGDALEGLDDVLAATEEALEEQDDATSKSAAALKEATKEPTLSEVAAEAVGLEAEEAETKPAPPPEPEPEEEAVDEEEDEVAEARRRAAEEEARLEALIPPEAEWYVVHTYAGYEAKVKRNLEHRIESMGMLDQIFQVVVPVEEEVDIKDGQRRIVERKIFPGYVLVRMLLNEDSWSVVRNTPAVTGFVGSGTQPTPLREDEVDKILRRMDSEEPQIRVSFRTGQNVRIVDGPFSDFHGVVDEIDMDRGKVRLMVNFFGRETPVELDFLQVEKV